MKTFIVLVFMIIPFTGMSQDKIEDHYKIYDTRTKQMISVDKIIGDCNKADVLFFGEEHNDSAGHYMENIIFRALHKQYGDGITLSLEMFEEDNQTALNDYLDGFIPEDRFSKDVRLWSNYKDYRPMIEYAKQNKLNVIAANPPRRYVSMVSRRGMRSLDSLSKDAKKFLPPLPYDTLTGRYREKFMETMKGSPGGGSPNIYYSQSLWDAGMSYSIYKFLKKHKHQKVFHCVGRFHCDEKLGTLLQLQKRKPGLKILNISSFSDASFSNPDWEKFSNLGDYIILTDPGLKKTY
ncbi:MAG TPA: ChaN family lipoprotein [Chitinophagaceae bacterium]|nr:ChaN family lipoprotein [Chitinophagaceae bacterium]